VQRRSHIPAQTTIINLVDPTNIDTLPKRVELIHILGMETKNNIPIGKDRQIFTSLNAQNVRKPLKSLSNLME